MWELISNIDERLKWDTARWIPPSANLGEHDGGLCMYMCLPKPPVPLVAAREGVVAMWKDESFGEG